MSSFVIVIFLALPIMLMSVVSSFKPRSSLMTCNTKPLMKHWKNMKSSLSSADSVKQPQRNERSSSSCHDRLQGTPKLTQDWWLNSKSSHDSLGFAVHRCPLSSRPGCQTLPSSIRGMRSQDHHVKTLYRAQLSSARIGCSTASRHMIALVVQITDTAEAASLATRCCHTASAG